MLPGETARLCIWEAKQLDKSMETVFVGFGFVGFVFVCLVFFPFLWTSASSLLLNNRIKGL